MSNEAAFQSWWRASKYCQVVLPASGWEQIARDGFFAALSTQGEAVTPNAVATMVRGLRLVRSLDSGVIKLCKDAAHMLEEQSKVALAVKTLGEWRMGYCDEEVTIEQASTGFGSVYQVRVFEGTVWLDYPVREKASFPSVEAAKAAAQQDFETRIRSALSLGHPIQGKAKEPSAAFQDAEESICDCGAAGSGMGHASFCAWPASEWKRWGDAYEALSLGHPIQGEAVAWSYEYLKGYDGDIPIWGQTQLGLADPRPILGDDVRNVKPLFASPQPPTPAGVREITEEIEAAAWISDHSLALLSRGQSGTVWATRSGSFKTPLFSSPLIGGEAAK